MVAGRLNAVGPVGGGHRVRGARSWVVHELGRAIVSNELVPGEILDLDALAEQLGLGRSGLREALMVLTAKGMLDARQGFGTFVTPRTDWNLLDPDLLRWHYDAAPDRRFLQSLNELREVIEPAAARVATLKHTEEDAAAIESALEQMSASGLDYEQYIEADLRLHSALLTASQNELLINLTGAIEAGLRSRNSMIPRTEQWLEAVEWHRNVVRAVLAGEPDAAEAAMRSLVARGCVDEDEALEASETSEPHPKSAVGTPSSA